MIAQPDIHLHSDTANLLEDLHISLSGSLLFSDHPEYDRTRQIWNGMFDKRPTMIVRCLNTADVAHAIVYARATGTEVSVRGGGHNSAGYAVCDGGMMIDLSQMKGITIDPITMTAVAEPGLTLGEFVTATSAYGLNTTTGTVSGTGMAGLTLGGGMGWLMGKYGLTIDNLLAVEIVTADGEILHASAEEHGDLFWAVRGGGGNFGIVTAFKYQLHPVDQVLAGMIVYPFEQAEAVLRFYRDFSHNAPDALTAYASLMTAPNGLPVVAIAVCYDGSFAEGERLLAPLRAFGQPMVDMIQPISYLNLVHLIDAGSPDGRKYYDRANSLPELSDEAIATIVDFTATRRSPFSSVLIQHVHGVAARIDPTATAAASLRGEQYLVGMVAAWEEGDGKQHIDWVRGFWEKTRPFARDGVYINFITDDGEARVRASFGENYQRLATIKQKYDPTNFFHLNQNIKPSA